MESRKRKKKAKKKMREKFAAEFKRVAGLAS